MITNKLVALVLSLCTVTGGAAAGAVANSDGNTSKLPTQSIVQKQADLQSKDGQTISFPMNFKNSCENIAPTVVKIPQGNSGCALNPGSNSNTQPPTNNSGNVAETPKVEAPKTEVPKVEVPKKEEPKTEAPKTEAPKVEQPSGTSGTTTPSTTTPSGVPANPNNKSFKYLDTVEKEILTYVNQERSKAGLKPLAWEENMRPIARYKSNNMLQYNYFEHNTPSLNNAGPMDLATKYFKYNTNGYGENIFYSQGYAEATTTAKYLVDQWMSSPGHRANILNANWTKMSAGVVFSSQGNYVYATQHFSTK